MHRKYGMVFCVLNFFLYFLYLFVCMIFYLLLLWHFLNAKQIIINTWLKTLCTFHLSKCRHIFAGIIKDPYFHRNVQVLNELHNPPPTTITFESYIHMYLSKWVFPMPHCPVNKKLCPWTALRKASSRASYIFLFRNFQSATTRLL